MNNPKATACPGVPLEALVGPRKGVKSAFGFYPLIKVNTANPKNGTILSGALICKGNMKWSIFGLGAVE